MCTAGKQGSASRRSLTRQHKVSSHKNTAVTKTIAVFFLMSDKVRPVSFYNRTVSRSSFQDIPTYIPLYGAVYPFLHSLLSLCFIFTVPVPPYSIPEARLFSLQSSIAGCQPCQVPLTLATGKSSSPTYRERIFRVLLAWTCHQSSGQKNNQPSVQKCIGGKTKKLILKIEMI